MAETSWKKILLAGQGEIVDADISAIGQAKISGLTTSLAGKVPTSRTVNGHALTGNVALVKADVGLGSVNNTLDLDKPISDLTGTALATKAPLASPVLTGNPTAPTPSTGDNSLRIATTAFVTNAVAGENTLAEMNDVVLTNPVENDFIVRGGQSDFVNKSASALNLVNTTQLATKQDVIGAGDLDIADVSGLQGNLDAKEPSFTKNTAFNKAFGSASGQVCQGNDSRLSDSRPASDVSAWAKAGTKPSYTASEVGALASTHDASGVTSAKISNWDGALTDIGDIQTLLASDETTLDTLQEVVDFIQTNRDDLDALSVSNISGLEAALGDKTSYISGVGAPSGVPTDGLGTFSVDTGSNDLWIYI